MCCNSYYYYYYYYHHHHYCCCLLKKCHYHTSMSFSFEVAKHCNNIIALRRNIQLLFYLSLFGLFNLMTNVAVI